MKGRPSKSTAVLKAQGTYDASRHADRLEAPPCHLERPECLSGEAAEFWDRTVPNLESLGIVSAGDVHHLTAMCTHWAIWKQMVEAWEPGEKVNQISIAWKSFDMIACRFGMTPSDRARIKTSGEKGGGFSAFVEDAA